MQQKLKAVFRSSSKKKASTEREDHSEATSPRSLRNSRQATSLDEQRRRQSSDSQSGGVQRSGRSRPLSSVYDHRGTKHNAIGSQSQFDVSEPADDSIASNYIAYQPAISPVNDSYDAQHMTLGGDRRLITKESDGRHEEAVADRNIVPQRLSLEVSKRKPLPVTPDRDVAGQSSHIGWHGRRSSPSNIKDMSRMPTNDVSRDEDLPLSIGGAVVEPKSTVNGQEEIEKEIEQMLSGVVDLRNTVDEDKVVQWAPAVTHEVVKPHEHEIIQHKIFREIHNYEYHHRVQPIHDIEVLPPRHWMPDPNGGGLVEISADQIASRTGTNRRWKIVQEHVESLVDKRLLWRTEPEIIEHPTTITDEGFERKETTILYPPTLQDMTDYDGPVQPIHFDHASGKQWLGEITSMHQLRQQLSQTEDPELSLRELADDLPEACEVNNVPQQPQSPILKRKPVG